jgi:hypothetical protein
MRAVISTVVLVTACVASPRGADTFESGMTMGADTSSSDESTSTLEGTSSSSSSGSSDDTAGLEGPNLDVAAPETDGNPGEIAEVFGHSGDTLYRMDADTKEVTTIGTFTGVMSGSIIDIALDADSNMYGAAFGALYSIDAQTAECTLIAEGSYPTSLSFVPAGTVDPDVEALVGYVDADYIRIDVETGDVTTIGSLSDGLESSGDIVSVKDGGTYLTVQGPPCTNGDCLIAVDPSTGELIQNFGELPWTQVFGLGFWGGVAYGFARDGTLFSVEFMPDHSLSTTPIEIPDGAEIEWFGAGSTTSAPPAEG